MSPAKPAAGRSAVEPTVKAEADKAVAPRRPGRPRDARADEVILDAAAKILAEQGLAGFSVDAIAALAGCGKATIYRRWASRSELLLETAELAAVDLPVPDTGTVREDLLVLLGGLATKMRDTQVGQLLAAVLAEAAVNPELQETFARMAHERRARCYGVIVRGMERGELRTDFDPEVATDLMAGPIFERVLFRHLPIDDGLVQRTVDIVLDGLRPRSPAAQTESTGQTEPAEPTAAAS
jgi:AcrR family transcriptional regulator